MQGGERGGAECSRLYLASLLIPKQQDLPFLSLQLLNPDKHKAPSVAPRFKGRGPRGKMGAALHAASKMLAQTHSFQRVPPEEVLQANSRSEAPCSDRTNEIPNRPQI